jgi:hypothetical protein
LDIERQPEWDNSGEEKVAVKFKTEVCLLLLAITLFVVSVFFYSYQGTTGDAASLSVGLAYPYRGIALALVGFGSISMITASVSYSKRNKNLLQ